MKQPLHAWLMTSVALTTAMSADAGIVVSTTLSKYQVFPGEALDVHMAAQNTDADPVTLTFGASVQAGYLLDGIGPTQSWGAAVITNRVIPGNSFYTWTVRNDWRFQPMAIGLHEIIGQVFGYGVAPPVHVNVVAPIYPTNNFVIDFDALPDNGPMPQALSEYWPMGVRFRTDSTHPGMIPTFQTTDSNRYLSANSSTNPPGFNIIADFDMPVFAAAVDVFGLTGRQILMIAKDADGNVLDEAVSPPLGDQFIPLSVTSPIPIASLEWWSSPNAGIRIDNLAISVPEPSATGMVLALGGLSTLLLPRRRGVH